MNPFLEDILKLPKQVYNNIDQILIEVFRPITQKLDEKNTKLKYVPSIITWSSNVLVHPISFFSGSHLFFQSISVVNFIMDEHKGYTETDGKKNINSRLVYGCDSLLKKTRVLPVLDSITFFGYTTYDLISRGQMNLEDINQITLGAGIGSMLISFATYIKHADDDEPKKPDKLFERSHQTIEERLANPEYM